MYREWKKIEFPKKYYIYMNLEATRLRGRPRNRWQDEVREDGRIAGWEGWQEKVHNRGEWKKLLRMGRNRCILHTPMEWMNEWQLSNTLVKFGYNITEYGICSCVEVVMGEVFSMRRHLASSWTLFPWHLVLLHWYRWYSRISSVAVIQMAR